jgi:aspartate 1-decarboxylase
MLIQVLKSKIHHATVTGANVEYVGSLTLDPDLARRAGLVAYEKVLVASLRSGRRLETYVILGRRGSREVVTNGAAARVIGRGERVIVMSFAQVTPARARRWKPTVLTLGPGNRPV